MKRGRLTAGAQGGGGRSLRLPISHDKIAAFCEKNGIRKFSLFGSILRDDFGPESDVDVVAEFRPGVRFSLFDLVDMEDELSKIVGRKRRNRGVPGAPVLDARGGRGLDGAVL